MAGISKYTKEIGDKICSQIATSVKGIHSICKLPGMPSPSTVFKWLNDHKEFSDNYARAKELQQELMAEEILDIADDGTNDTIHTDKGEFENKEWVNRSKLRVDSRKWLLSKLAPKKYGDKVEVSSTNTNYNHNTDLSKEDLAAISRQLEAEF